MAPITDSRDEVILPATVADLLVWESLPVETQRAVKSALWEEIGEMMETQGCSTHDAEIDRLETELGEAHKTIRALQELVKQRAKTAAHGWENFEEEVNDMVKKVIGA